ncbi:LuxR C-terminal-related transcriptional regulator [Streptosporangium sandarakinum]|uniref:LuxR C-terminal-related transcriptional regulator n=1 Tax=Streptosporangium sandarakinum TaxID=1260955 RepID=UPI003723A7EC
MEARQLTDVADTATAGLDDVIEVGGLRQRYGGFEAVRDVSFTVARGEIFALLGTNGAGKTTTTEVLEGFRPASGGTVRVLGLDPEPAAPAMMAGESPLTARERDALALAAQGAQAGEIAAALHLTEGTVRNYLSAAITKLGAPNRITAIRVAQEKGWL